MTRTTFPRTSLLLAALGLAAVTMGATGCAPGQNLRPDLYQDLPQHVNVPDGLTLDAAGNLILASPNFVDQRYPGVLAQITPQDELRLWFAMPVHPETKQSGPMGLEFGPDGNLYVADNQYFWNTEYASRLIRVIVKNGKAVDAEVVVEGFKLANAVRWKGDFVYVSDTFFDLADAPGTSGVYRFHIDEFAGAPVKLKPKGENDPHLVATFVTQPNERGDVAGADGLAFDGQGNLYCSLFGNGDVYKLTFDAQGNVAAKTRFVHDPRCPCGDGICYDAKANVIYIADSQNNAIHVIHMDGRFETLWENEDASGANGLLDQPCEPIVRGDDLIISNFDGDFPGLKNKGADEHRTMSIIHLQR